MTKVHSLDPPKLATWLLEQFSPVLDAPLAGDLVESFRQGRSAGWYWKQVLWAILLVFLYSLRKQWGRLAYAIVCSGLISAIWPSMFHVTARVYARSVTFVDGGMRLYWDHAVQATTLPAVYALYAESYGIPWPWSLVCQIGFLTVFQALIVASALGAYLGFARILKPQNFLRALMLVVAVLASSNVAATFLSVLRRGVQLPLWIGAISTPTIIIALLIGMWMADPGTSAQQPVSA